MPRTRKTDSAQPSSRDTASNIMAALLPVHSAITLDWLADAAATAAERALNAGFAFVYFEDQDGRLDRRAPASDLRRRSQQRAIDAFGKDVLRTCIDPKDAPAIAEALDARTPITATAAELFRGLAAPDKAEAAQKQLGIAFAAVVPLESAGERVGALLLMFAEQPQPEHMRLFADHVACAAVNLQQSQAARDQGVVDITRALFDTRKLESDLQKEVSRAARYHHQVSIAVVEATNLRLLRERFGDTLTDRLLQRLGGALAENARDIDVIGAYKESGYTMILTEASAEGAAIAAERLLRTAQGARLDESVPGLELHLVCGWATCPRDGSTTAALFAAAERRMYEAAA
ncbi:MAG: diguanylate cyclase [Chloroflexi bacterium]|nr:diguanylate cyclase [Chloroflexota bacterium]